MKTFAAAWLGLVLAAGWLRAEAEPARPRFALQAELWNVYDQGSPDALKRWLESNGVEDLMLAVADREGGYYFWSQALKSAQWNAGPDLLAEFQKAWHRDSRPSKKEAVHLGLDASSLMREDMGEETISRLVLDLAGEYRFPVLALEPMREDIDGIVRSGFAPFRKSFILLCSSPRFDSYLLPAFKVSSAAYASDRWVSQEGGLYPITRTSLPGVGLGDVVFSLARTHGREVWLGLKDGPRWPAGLLRNLLRYRARQFSPDGYLLPLSGFAGSGLEDLKADLPQFQSRAETARKRPTANLAISVPERPAIALPEYVEPITNALFANGYDVRTTVGRILPGADLYYVVGEGDWTEQPGFLPSVLSLMDAKKSHFYGSVILHPLSEIPNYGAWKDLRAWFKVPDTEVGRVAGMPGTVVLEGKEYLWKGRVDSDAYGTSFIRKDQVYRNHGEILLSETFQNETLALILKSAGHYLINGNLLHLEAAYFLSQLMGGALLSPAAAYVVSGRDRTTVLAADDTELKLKIPAAEAAATWEWRLYGADGNLLRTEIEAGKDVLEKRLQAGQLLVLDCK